MSIVLKISGAAFDFIILCVFFLVWSDMAYPQNSQIPYSGNIQDTFTLKSNENNSICQNSSKNFYRTDSIFSSSSPKGYIPSLFQNFGRQVVAPFHFRTKEWIATGAALGITVVLIKFDSEIDDWAKVQKQKHRWVNKTSPAITEFGGNFGVCSAIGFGLVSAAFSNEKGVQTSLLATQAMITSGLWVHIIKEFSGRERPMASYNISKAEGGKWHGPFAQFDQDLAVKRPGSSFDSFPSGHTATAFSIATVFASQYSDIKAIPIISYSVASLVGISRLTEHEHWASDVFAGALLGYFCGKQVVGNFNKTHHNSLIPRPSGSISKADLNFTTNGNQIGIFIRW